MLVSVSYGTLPIRGTEFREHDVRPMESTSVALKNSRKRFGRRTQCYATSQRVATMSKRQRQRQVTELLCPSAGKSVPVRYHLVRLSVSWSAKPRVGSRLIEQYNNTLRPQGCEVIPDSRRHADGSTEVGSTARIQGRDGQAVFRPTEERRHSRQELECHYARLLSPKRIHAWDSIAMFELQKNIVNAKLILMKKLNTLSNIDTFVKTSKGYKVTGEEGYVAIDRMSGDAVKLVDRMEFSYNNFSPDIIKGWDSPSRG